MPNSKKIYSRQYPPDPDIVKLLNTPRTEEEKNSAKKSFAEFWRCMKEEAVYIPMPERIKASTYFIERAKELSEVYELDMDIWEKTYFIQVDLHLRCAAYTTGLTRRVAELFSLCDQFHSFIQPQGPGDFTLSLDFYTHQYYLSGRLING